ncbi:protein of unknown function [Pedobacter steynii]|uniref:DUF4296 domain-containing protein n=1 Tax=Pedobacter steynii TaxID=430522 RepID=A0A1G9P3B0_9SPHI|nr:DUF4296 domain-containing protein [Pedobacter steynii]NQX39116.1 DUF4296 domain-containing protein [Pedobacter steynii]SDL92727.1 protein of unknown function [Pedobacter steynii]
MRNFLYIVFLFLLISGCKPGIPKQVIQPDQMSGLLADIHIVDGYVSSIPSSDSAKKVAAAYYKGIYKKYGVDSAKYAKSMAYYNSEPKVLDEIYTKVVADLSRQKAIVVKSDSLSNAKIQKALSLKNSADSLLRADPEYKIRFLLKDTTKKKIDFIQPKMVYKEPKL